MYDQKTKTITNRALSNNDYLYISDQGDVTDLETTVWRGSRTARRWVKVKTRTTRPRFNMITKADSISLDKNDVLITTGTRVDRISGEALDSVHPSMRRPSGQSLTIDGWREQNRVAMKALDAARGRDLAIPSLFGVQIRSHGSTTVGAYATDRFKLTSAILETTSKPVDFTTIISAPIIRELAMSPAWHLSVWEDWSIAEFCDTGVRVQRMNYKGKYPDAKSLFPEGSVANKTSLEVNPLPLARVLSGLNATNQFPAGLSADGLLAADGSGTFRPEGFVDAKSMGEVRQWVAFRPDYLASLLRSVAGIGHVNIEWSTDWKPIIVNVSDRISMLLMPVTAPGDEFPVEDEIEVL